VRLEKPENFFPIRILDLGKWLEMALLIGVNSAAP